MTQAACLCPSLNVSRLLCRVNQLHREVLTLRTQLKSCKKLARVRPLSLSHTLHAHVTCARISRTQVTVYLCCGKTNTDTFASSGLVKYHITPVSPGQCVPAQKELMVSLAVFRPHVLLFMSHFLDASPDV